MQQFIRKYRLAIIATLLGALAGFLYWFYIGCSSGTCPIQSHSQSSTLYGALLGYLLGSSFNKKEKTTTQDPDQTEKINWSGWQWCN